MDSSEPTKLRPSPPGPTALIEYSQLPGPLQFLQALVDEYGEVVQYRTRLGPCFLFAHPEHAQAIFRSENFRRASLVKLILGEGLLASDGALWRSQRQLMNRDFAPRRVAPFIPLMLREIERTAAEWHHGAVAGKEVDIASSMTRLTLRVVVASLFSTDLADEEAAALCAGVTEIINEVGKFSWTIFGAEVNFTPEGNAEFRRAKAVIDEMCHNLISRRRGTPQEERPRDLLSMLIESGTGDAAAEDRQLRDEMVTMLIGGHETTALALAWAWKALAEQPAIERKLLDEIDLATAKRDTDAASISALTWTRAIFQEAMRLYPPVWQLARVAVAESSVGDYTIPKGACVLVSAWITHRHPGFWKEPERFAPERFLDPGQSHDRDAYFP